jgi:hypothetical protein
MEFQLGAWLLHFIGDTFTFGSLKSLKDLPNAISWSYGLGWLSWMVLGVPFRRFITEPLEWYYNERYPTQTPTPSQLISFRRRGLISVGDFDLWMKRLGWRDLWIQALLELDRNQLPISVLSDLYRWGKVGGTEVLKYLKNKGYWEDEALTLMNYWVEERVKRLQEEYADEVARSWIAGVEGTRKEELRAAYKLEGWTDEEISWLDLVLDQRKLRRAKSKDVEPADEDLAREQRRYITQLGYAYRDGKITAQDVRMELRDLGYSEEAIRVFLRRVNLERYRRGIAPRWERVPSPP